MAILLGNGLHRAMYARLRELGGHHRVVYSNVFINKKQLLGTSLFLRDGAGLKIHSYFLYATLLGKKVTLHFCRYPWLRFRRRIFLLPTACSLVVVLYATNLISTLRKNVKSWNIHFCVNNSDIPRKKHRTCETFAMLGLTTHENLDKHSSAR